MAYLSMVLLDSRNGTLRAQYTSSTVWLTLVAAAGFFVAVWWAERREIPRVWLWSLPIAFRVLLLFTTPTLSDDVYRYLWDGHVATEGISPYTYAVDDSALDSVEIPIRQQVNNPTLSTPYLPTAQAVFFGTALVLPAKPLVMQAVMTVFDLLTALLLVRLLALAQLPAQRIMLYLWNPLVIVEMAHGAHLDSIMTFLAVASLWVAFNSQPWSARSWLSPILFGLSVLTRPVPLLLAPVLFWRWSWGQRFASLILPAAIIAPFAWFSGLGIFGTNDGTGVFGAARAYTQEFRFNSGVFHWTEQWMTRRGFEDPAQLVRIVIGVAMVAIVLCVWWLAKGTVDARRVLRLAAIPFAAYVALTPVLHPWYVVVLVAFGVFVAPGADEHVRQWLWLTPLAWLVTTLPVSYLTYRDPDQFGELEWIRRLEWIPALLLLGFAANYAILASLRQRSPRNPDPVIA